MLGRSLVLVAVLTAACATSGATTMQPVKYGTLTVVVTASGARLSGAVVTVGGQTKTTGATGTVAFTLVLRQQYVVSAIAQGYLSWTTSLWFQKTQTVSATMQPAVVVPASVRILSSTPMPKGGP